MAGANESASRGAAAVCSGRHDGAEPAAGLEVLERLVRFLEWPHPADEVLDPQRPVEVEVDRVADVVGHEAARPEDGELAPEDVDGPRAERVERAANED